MTTAYLTNKAMGYPSRGDARRVAPRRLVCIHATYNTSTPLATAQQERDYANRTGSNGPSAHSYLNRDGTWVHAIDPDKYAAWSNGGIRSPRLNVPGVAEVVDLLPGHNPNEDYYREIETCARYPDLPITVEQRQAIAEQIARDSLTTGLPIGRATVHLHGDLDTVNKANCPVPAKDAEAWVADVIRSAREWSLMLQLDAVKHENAELDKALDAALDDMSLWINAANRYETQRDEAVAWGKRLQAFGGAILATDKPEWVE